MIWDNTQAYKEGWTIAYCPGSENGLWQMLAQPSLGEHVWDFVRRKAASGSAYHMDALAFIRKHNPPEYDLLMKWTCIGWPGEVA